MELLIGLVILLLVATIILVIVLRPKNDSFQSRISEKIESLQSGLKEDFRIIREETNSLLKESRLELKDSLKEFRIEIKDTMKTSFDSHQLSLDAINKTIDAKLTSINEQSKTDNTNIRDVISKSFKDFNEAFDKNMGSFNELQREKFSQLEDRQGKLVESTEKKLEEIRTTVDEKLQKTLNERLGQSFELVGKQLENVQKGLGEMQTLAQDVGGLKKVLSNVKMRGGFGEVQLSLLLEQILAPEQYESNVKIKPTGSERVEFAIKLPGRDEMNSVVWIPIDAKFPKDVYEQLQTAYELNDLPQVEICQRNLEITIKRMAKDIHDKYIDPPNTTDFAIMFLPFEGIYGEVVRKASLLEALQREYKIVVTGPTTLAAILNSLQMGFRSLAIQKRSSEVWSILASVKKEFDEFGGLLGKAQNNIQTGLNQLDDVLGKRTRAIQRKLKNVQIIEEVKSLQNIQDSNILEDPSAEKTNEEEEDNS